MTVESVTTSNGRPALDALRRLVAAEKTDDPLAPVTVLVPNNIAGLSVRRHLARGVTDGRGIAGIFISTLPRLAEQLAAASQHPRTPATATVVAAAWRSVLDEPDRPGGNRRDRVDARAPHRRAAHRRRPLRPAAARAVDGRRHRVQRPGHQGDRRTVDLPRPAGHPRIARGSAQGRAVPSTGRGPPGNPTAPPFRSPGGNGPPGPPASSAAPTGTTGSTGPSGPRWPPSPPSRTAMPHNREASTTPNGRSKPPRS